MKKKFLRLLLLLVSIFSIACSQVSNTSVANDKDIVILFTNDVHCGLTDNVTLAGMMKYYKDLDNQNVYKALVDAGDFSQGNAVGSTSKGEELFKLVDKLGYDFVVPGNHEFDYGIKKFIENSLYLSGKLYSCNIVDLRTNEPLFDGYKIMNFGSKKVAFVGVTTPWTITSTKPSNLVDENGKTIVGFMQDEHGNELFNVIQKNVDQVKNEGADYVVLVCHVGEPTSYNPYYMENLVKHLKGIDAVIDGHSHSVYNTIYKDANGKEIPGAQTGTKMQNFGRLDITKDGKVSIELIDKVDGKDPEAEKIINDLLDKVKEETSAIVYKDNKVHLTINDLTTGKRRVRNGETNLGDFFADAVRYAGNSDIAFVNGGAIRSDINIGDVTYNDIINVAPFFTPISTAKISGKQLLDFLEFYSSSYPEEQGGFVQCSGFSYDIDTTIKPSVEADANGNFVKVNGEYRVKNVMVGGEPLDLEKYYTSTSNDYVIVEHGGGATMLNDAEIINKDFTIETDVLADYFKVADFSKYTNPEGEGRIGILVN